MLAVLSFACFLLAVYSLALGHAYIRQRRHVRQLLKDGLSMLCVLYRLRRIFKNAADSGHRLTLMETKDGYAMVLSTVGDTDERACFRQAEIYGVALFKKPQ